MFINNMYLGIDFLITPELELYLSEVNVGLPGGAHEYDLTHRVHMGNPSDVYHRIEQTSQRIYRKPFKDYLYSLPFIESLKPLKIWMDGMGPYPTKFHPGLRLEDKWVQYQIIRSIALMPETILFNPEDHPGVERFIEKKGQAVLKRRVGRGGRGFQLLTDSSELSNLDLSPDHYLLQEYVESRIESYSFSVRSVAFGGEFICMYANLSLRSNSNHGLLFYIDPGDWVGLKEKEFQTVSFVQKSWEAEIWFGPNDPPYLKHNLYEEAVADTPLLLPGRLIEMIRTLSVTVERVYEEIDLSSLPKACFEG